MDAIQQEKNEIYKDIYDLRPGAPTPDDLTYLLNEYGVDDAIVMMRRRAPATADLLTDVQAAGGI